MFFQSNRAEFDIARDEWSSSWMKFTNARREFFRPERFTSNFFFRAPTRLLFETKWFLILLPPVVRFRGGVYGRCTFTYLRTRRYNETGNRFRDATRELRAQTTICGPQRQRRSKSCRPTRLVFGIPNVNLTAGKKGHCTKIRRACFSIYNRDSRIDKERAKFVLRTEFFGKILKWPYEFFLTNLKIDSFTTRPPARSSVACEQSRRGFFRRKRRLNVDGVFTDGRMKLISRDSFRVCRQY